MKKTISALIAAIMAVSCLAPSVLAADYNFKADDKNDVFYQSTSYMIMAAKALNLSHDSIRALESLMLEKMDFYSEEQAEREYRSF